MDIKVREPPLLIISPMHVAFLYVYSWIPQLKSPMPVALYLSNYHKTHFPLTSIFAGIILNLLTKILYKHVIGIAVYIKNLSF